MGGRRPLLVALAVVAMGVADQLLAAPAAAVPPVACTDWCWNQCPSDLNQFCHDHGCAGGWASCTLMQCQDIYGRWWNYYIACGQM